ncbi:MAG: gamma-glutamyltransferase, partial [Proteobacteria bacterium]
MTLTYLRPDQYRYPGRRSDVFARNIVATSQPLAVEAGLDMLRDGGNAIDAAIAAAICLAVVEPTGNGVGSDAFAIVHHDGELAGFNGSGKSPATWSRERFAGHDAMPAVGWEAVTVPGAVDTWVQLSRRYGRIPFAELFQPAINYARSGFAV